MENSLRCKYSFSLLARNDHHSKLSQFAYGFFILKLHLSVFSPLKRLPSSNLTLTHHYGGTMISLFFRDNDWENARRNSANSFFVNVFRQWEDVRKCHLTS